jgi:hypothetical protein
MGLWVFGVWSDHIRHPYGNQMFIEWTKSFAPVALFRGFRERISEGFPNGHISRADELGSTWHIAWRARFDRAALHSLLGARASRSAQNQHWSPRN